MNIEPNTSFAIARIDDGEDGADAVSVLTNDAGDVIGFTAEVLVLTGAFANMRIVAAITAPIGSEVPDLPQPGTSVMVAFTSHEPSTGAYIIGQIPGGTRVIPKATAGIAVSDDGLANTQVRMPPKGVGVRHYVRGAPYLIRLKGAQPDFRGEFYVEADDADKSPDGQAGTRICIAMDPSTGLFAAKMREASGASITCVDGAVLISSPNGQNSIQISDDGIFVCATYFTIQANSLVKIDGATIALNVPAPLIPSLVPGSPFAALYGVSGPSGIPSTGVFIGA